MKKALIILLTLLSILSYSPAVFAASLPSQNTTFVLEDGSYFITTLVSPNSLSVSTSSTRTGKKTSTYYSSSNTKLWSVTVTGTFSYNGSTSVCTKSSVSTTIYAPTWKVKQSSSSKKGYTASASATVSQYLNSTATSTITRSVSLSCDKNGKLS